MSDHSSNTSFPTLEEWNFMMELGRALVTTGFMPRGVDTPAKAAAIMLKGRELGIPPMEAIANISIIGGAPTLQAKLMMALVKRAYGRDAIWVEETTDTYAKVGYKRGTKSYFYTFSMDDAERAGLTADGTNRDGSVRISMYKTYPGPMLRSRCISAVCVMEFPEVTGGLYVPGELGEDVIVDSAGEVITVDVNPTTPPRNQPSQEQKPRTAPTAAPPAQIESPKSQTGPVIDMPDREAEPTPVRGTQATAPKQQASQQQQRRRTTEDQNRDELKKKIADVARGRGISTERVIELLRSWYHKEPGNLTLVELQNALHKMKNAEGPELSRPAAQSDETRGGGENPK